MFEVAGAGYAVEVGEVLGERRKGLNNQGHMMNLRQKEDGESC